MAGTKAIEDYKRIVSSDFSEEISDWLFEIYLKHGNQINKTLYNSLKICPEFILAISEEDYKSVANDVFPSLIKKHSYLIDFDDKLFTELLDKGFL